MSGEANLIRSGQVGGGVKSVHVRSGEVQFGQIRLTISGLLALKAPILGAFFL